MAKRKRKKKIKVSIPSLVAIIMIFTVSYFVYESFIKGHPDSFKNTRHVYRNEAEMLQGIEKHFGNEIENCAREFKLPSSYLKALIALECSGNPNPPSRFEKHVFASLKKVRDGQLRNYGSIRRRTIKDASDGALKNLASSWGPFQLMGYQCIEMGINVKDIRGKERLYYGVKWINKRYGKYLKKGQYRDAFHIHNTGRPVPSSGKTHTYDPKYIPNGMSFIQFFENKKRNQVIK